MWFREEHPDWSILTEIIDRTETFAIIRATIKNEKGDLIATAIKQESKADFGDFLEKAETSSIGRALALCGYGTAFAADDLHEGVRLADSPLPGVQG